jgi:hypothetical protein
VARELGYGELSTLSEADRDQVTDEAEQYVALWGRNCLNENQPHHSPDDAFAAAIK